MTEPFTDADLDREPLDPDEERACLNAFLRSFEMQPDVRSAIEHKFWQRKSLYRVIVQRINAYDRLKANIAYADSHRGNVVIEVKGRKRHGKSTFARWYCQLRQRLRTGSTEGWEAKVIYEKAYSGTTMEVMRLAERLRGESDTDSEVIAKLYGYIIVLDEALIEHEKDSVKAKHDLQNIIGACGVAQMDFLFLSVEARGIYPDFTVWVVGVDSRRKLTLSFYYSSDGICYGALITPNVEETEKYQAAKASVVVTTLIHGGRTPAEVKGVTAEEGAFDFTQVSQDLEANPDVLAMLRAYTATALHQAGRASDAIKRWELATFDGLSASKIKRQLEESVTVRAINDSIDKTRGCLSEVAFGAILEHMITDYLNQETAKGSVPAATSNTCPRTDLVRNLSWVRRGGSDAPDVVLVDAAGTVHASVACKYYPGARQNLWDCRPEHTACPPCAWLVLVEPDPRTTRLHHAIHHLPPDGDGVIRRGFLTKLRVPWTKWLDQMRELVASDGG